MTAFYEARRLNGFKLLSRYRVKPQVEAEEYAIYICRYVGSTMSISRKMINDVFLRRDVIVPATGGRHRVKSLWMSLNAIDRLSERRVDTATLQSVVAQSAEAPIGPEGN